MSEREDLTKSQIFPLSTEERKSVVVHETESERRKKVELHKDYTTMETLSQYISACSSIVNMFSSEALTDEDTRTFLKLTICGSTIAENKRTELYKKHGFFDE